MGFLALPGAAQASHLDGHVFTFATGQADPIYWCVNMPAWGSCFNDGEPVTQYATSTWSGRYLGPYDTDSISLQGMDYLEIGARYANKAYLSFDLILTRIWGGNGVVPDEPDFESLFKVVANGRTLLDTSFASEREVFQAYPGTHPQASNPGGTGAVFYSATQSVYHHDLVFDFSLLPNQCCTDVSITFSASFGPEYAALGLILPKWGLDNVVVSSTPIPEPASAALLGLGLLALGARRRRA